MKRLTILIAALLMAFIFASPALAQSAVDQYAEDCEYPGNGEEPITLTGVVEELGTTVFMYGSHSLTNESSGVPYFLRSEAVDLDLYTGERVTVYGTLFPYENGQIDDSCPPLVDVARVERAEESEGPTEYTRTGSIIAVLENGIRVSEDPSLSVEDEGYCAKTYDFLLEDTEILRQQNGAQAPANADALQKDQMVEVTYTENPDEAFPAICPPQRKADRVIILGEPPETPREGSPDDPTGPQTNPQRDESEDPEDGPTLLPDTGGMPLPIAGDAILIVASGLLLRRLAG